METKYWEQVLAISDNGWAICRLPHEKHTLGVRVGFLEAAPVFKNSSLAALRREKDGNISLDQGIVSTEPQILRVRIRSNNEDIGASLVPAPISDDAPIESRILQARNTIFFSELWQELNREARTLASFGVRSKEGSITCPLSPLKTIILDLVPLGKTFTPSGRVDDKVAEGLFLAFCLLLTYQHRQNSRRRTQQPPPISSQKRPNPAYNLLRPVITRLDHQRAVTSIHTLLIPLSGVLSSAGLSPPPYYSITSTLPTHTTASLSSTESIVLSMIDRLESITTFHITDNVTITITSRTAMFPVAGTVYLLSLQPEDCPLIQTCKAPSSLDAWWKVEDYVLFATGCALTSLFSPPSSPVTPLFISEHEGEEVTDTWQPTVQPYILRKRFRTLRKSKQLSFRVVKSPNAAAGGPDELLRVRTRWEWIGDVAAKDRKIDKAEGSYEWQKRIGGKEKGGSKWDDGEGEVIRTLREVVEEAGRG